MGQSPRKLTPNASARHRFGAELRDWRIQRGLSQDELGRLVLHSGDMISKVEKATRWPTAELVERCDAALDASGALTRLWPAVRAEQGASRAAIRSQFHDSHESGHDERVMVRPSTDLFDPTDAAVYRRHFLGSGGAALFRLATGAATTSALARLVSELTTYGAGTDTESLPLQRMTVGGASRAVARAKVLYQASRYGDVMQCVPDLMDTLSVMRSRSTGDDLARIHALTADAYHVAGSVLLKLNDPTLAALAADRSMRAAHDSGAPTVVGSSARILTHTLLSAGHPVRAWRLASDSAQRLLSDAPHTPEAFAVFGALVLRGAVAAAHAGQKDDADELLDTAARAANHVGDGRNLRWTGFDATNVQLHRINIALTFGDAGTAIATARLVDMSKVPLAERKACLHLDVAEANAMCNRWESALEAVRCVEQVAPEELQTRPAAKRLVTQLATRASRSVRAGAVELAQRSGISL